MLLFDLLSTRLDEIVQWIELILWFLFMRPNYFHARLSFWGKIGLFVCFFFWKISEIRRNNTYRLGFGRTILWLTLEIQTGLKAPAKCSTPAIGNCGDASFPLFLLLTEFVAAAMDEILYTLLILLFVCLFSCVVVLLW